MMESGPEFVGAFFGTLLAGAVPSPVARPNAFQNVSIFREHLGGVFRSTEPKLLVVSSCSVKRLELRGLLPNNTQLVEFEDLVAPDQTNRSWESPDPASLALVQFTSGSRGVGRAVRVSYQALEANIHMIRQWLQWSPEDGFACWLPLYHDMGLVGALLCSVTGQSPLWLLKPEQFIRNPLRYLRCFADRSVAILRYHAEGAAVVYIDAPKGTIARTSSGKPRRRLLWQSYLEAGLAGQVLELESNQESGAGGVYGKSEIRRSGSYSDLSESGRNREVDHS